MAAYRRRRRLTNMLLRRRFVRPHYDPLVVIFGAFQPAAGFVGGDGVHPSPEGWRELGTWIRQVADL